MNDNEFDALLDRAAAPMERRTAVEARLLADATMPARIRRRERIRPRWVLPAVVAGALLLTAGTATSSALLAHWAHVELPDGNIRNELPIRISWVTESGHEERCRVYLELRNPGPNDITTLDAAVRKHDWTGLGQRLYETTPVPQADIDAGNADPEGEGRVGEGLTPVMQSFAQEVFPGIPWFGEQVDRPVRAVDAWGMNCAPETP